MLPRCSRRSDQTTRTRLLSRGATRRRSPIHVGGNEEQLRCQDHEGAQYIIGEKLKDPQRPTLHFPDVRVAEAFEKPVITPCKKEEFGWGSVNIEGLREYMHHRVFRHTSDVGVFASWFLINFRSIQLTGGLDAPANRRPCRPSR